MDRRLSKNLKEANFHELCIDKFTADVDIGSERYLGKRLNGLINRTLVCMMGPHIIGMAVK